MHVKSTINNRFSHTTITTKVKNVADVAQETVFSIALPEEAFIAGFVMEVDGKNYTALVKEKEAAKVDYEQVRVLFECLLFTHINCFHFRLLQVVQVQHMWSLMLVILILLLFL